MMQRDFCLVYIESVENNSAKAAKYFMSWVILIYHLVFPGITEVGTADVWIILDFQATEHTKVRLLVGSQSTTFVCSIE
jgi:hypothetical protein